MKTKTTKTTKTLKLSRSALTVAGGAAALTLVASVTVAGGLPGQRPPRRPAVDVAASPEALQVVGLPCLPTSMQVQMTNPGAEDVFADTFVTPGGPLELDRGVFSSQVPAGRTVSAPVEVRAPRDAEPGSYGIELDAGHGVVEVPVEVQPLPGKGPGDNLALGEQDFSSSRHGTFRPCGGVDGDRDSAGWAARRTGWNDATSRVFPDTYGVQFAEPLIVGRVDLYTLDSPTNPATRDGLRDWDVQVRVDGVWQTVAQVRGNTAGMVSSTFPPVTADAVQVVTLASNDGNYSRIIELEAYSA